MLGNTNAKIVIGSSQQQGEYFIKVVDYDGTVLDEKWLDEGAEYTLPTPPTHDRLIFQEWVSVDTITNNKLIMDDHDVVVGAVYTTASGKNEFDITLNTETGLTTTLRINGTKDWGDGTTPDTETTHTYASAGSYTIQCDGTTITSSSGNGCFGQGNNKYVTAIRLATISNIPQYSFRNCFSLFTITFSKSVTTIEKSSIDYCYSLQMIIVPSTVSNIGSSFTYRNYGLKGVVYSNNITSTTLSSLGDCKSIIYPLIVPDNITSLPGGSGGFQYVKKIIFTKNSKLTSVGQQCFYNNYYIKEIILPNNVINIGNEAFRSCYGLEKLILPDNAILGNFEFSDCYSLEEVKMPKNLTGGLSVSFQSCAKLKKIEIPSGITSFNVGDMFNSCYGLTELKLPKDIPNIPSATFANCYSLLEFDFSEYTIIPTLVNTNAFSNINFAAKIKVPAALYDQWIVATNWVTYADYIVAV